MCLKRIETKAGVNYSVMNERQVKDAIHDKTVEFRIVHRKTDGVVFLEIHERRHGEKRDTNSWVTVPITSEDVKFIASAFVEISAEISAKP